MTALPPRPAATSPLDPLALWAVACLVAVCSGAAWSGAARAQGQDSTTSPSGPQTVARPPPLLSTVNVTAVPSGTPKPGAALPARERVRAPQGLALPGPIALAPPARLVCGDIRDPTARARCEARPAPPAPPKGAEP